MHNNVRFGNITFINKSVINKSLVDRRIHMRNAYMKIRQQRLREENVRQQRLREEHVRQQRLRVEHLRNERLQKQKKDMSILNRTVKRSTKNASLKIIWCNNYYFEFETSQLDKYLNNTMWGIEDYSNYNNGTILSCKNNEETFDIIVWRKPRMNRSDLSRAHGRHITVDKKVNFNENDTIEVSYNDNRYINVISKYTINNILPNHKFYLSANKYFENKKIIVVGNGCTGFKKNVSNKFIDSHDIVVRINSF